MERSLKAIGEAEKAPLPDRCCGKCRYAVSDGSTNQLVCCVDPPQVVVLPAGPGQFKAGSMLPPVQPQNFCSHFGLKNSNEAG